MTPFDIKTFISDFFHRSHSREARDGFGWWLVNNNHQRETEEALDALWKESPSEISPETIGDLARLHATIDSRQMRLRRIRIMKWAAAAVIVAAVSATATFFGTKTYLADKYQGTEMAKVSVPDGASRWMTLADSTRVFLAGGSTLVSPSTFNGETRTVFLIGKARFSVAKDKEHPFLVRTQGMTVKAIGTRFTVDAYPTENIESTTLEQGITSVGVENTTKSGYDWRMRPGQRLTYDKLSGDVTLTNATGDGDHDWTKGWLVFNGETFPTIANTLQHRFGVRIACDNMQRLRGRYYVKFAPNENLSDVLRVLSKLGADFKYQREGNNVYIR